MDHITIEPAVNGAEMDLRNLIREGLAPVMAEAVNGPLQAELRRVVDLERIRRKELLTAEEVEALYDFKVATLATWRCRGGGPDFFKRGAIILYRNRDVARFVDERIVKGRG
uniref:Helix-turn-helix domain-containing protein n=1 Tax=Desulfovibrio sp. U5L TaxID=596152 RepID=I2Q2L7_9BACT